MQFNFFLNSLTSQYFDYFKFVLLFEGLYFKKHAEDYYRLLDNEYQFVLDVFRFLREHGMICSRFRSFCYHYECGYGYDCGSG